MEYIDGMGESGLKALHDRWDEIYKEAPFTAYFNVYRVPLAASEESHRSFAGEYADAMTWDQIREKHGYGRYEVVLMGPPPHKKVKGLVKRLAQKIVYKTMPWMDNREERVALGRASAAMFDTIDFGQMKPPVPKPIGSKEQPSLFNPRDMAIPAYVKTSDTSFLAAESIAPVVDFLQKKVLDVILSNGTKGMTCDEVEVAIDMPHQTASARINELMKERDERPAMLFDSGSRRKTRHGQLATVWMHRVILFG